MRSVGLQLTQPVPNLVQRAEAFVDVILINYLTTAGMCVCDFAF